VKPLSIRLRLSLMVLVFTLTITSVLSISAYIEFEESLLGNIDDTLTAMAEGIQAELYRQDNREHREAALRAITGYGTSERSSQYRIWLDGSERDIFASDSSGGPLPPALLHLPAEEQPDVNDFTLFNVAGDPESKREYVLRAIWMRHISHEGITNILVARSCAYVYHELGEFLGLLLMVGGSVTLLTVLLVPIVISHGLHAITDLGAKLGQITHSSLKSDAGILPEVPIELKPFKAALQEMLLRLHEAMQRQEQLTADVAHELRTPLAIIKSTLQTLRMRARPATEYEQGIDDALKDVDRMEHLVSQLLSLARLDAAGAVRNPAAIRLHTLLESLTDVFDDRARQQGGRVVFENSAPVSVRGDETELWQLFSNLLDNAIRYGPREGLIRVDLRTEPDAWATVCVHDEGGAIPPESLPHVFDRFYRVDASRSPASGGSGLGLAIACGIAQRHGGHIDITSDPQAGTSVVVRLPRV
jgi:signal transduction histidine kinase